MALVAHPAHRQGGQAPLPLAALADAEFVMGGRATIGDRLVDARLARAGLPARRIMLISPVSRLLIDYLQAESRRFITGRDV